MNVATALAEIQALSRDERIQLVQAIWDGIAAEQVSPEMTPELEAELDRRIAESEADPQNFVTWEEIKASLRKPS